MMRKFGVGFGYEQATLDNNERMYGFYIYDLNTGLVVMSEDVWPTEEIENLLQGVVIEIDHDNN